MKPFRATSSSASLGPRVPGNNQMRHEGKQGFDRVLTGFCGAHNVSSDSLGARCLRASDREQGSRVCGRVLWRSALQDEEEVAGGCISRNTLRHACASQPSEGGERIRWRLLSSLMESFLF